MTAAFMPYLSKPFRDIVDLYRKSLTGVQRQYDRWEFCEITTERFFSYLITAMFAESTRKETYALNDAVWNFYGHILQKVEESKFVIDLGTDMFSVMEHCHISSLGLHTRLYISKSKKCFEIFTK